MSASISVRFLAPLVCARSRSPLGVQLCHRRVGLLIGFRSISTPRRSCRRMRCRRRTTAHRRTPALRSRDDTHHVMAILALFIKQPCSRQPRNSRNAVALWADANTDRTISLLGGTAEDSDDVVSGLQSLHDFRLHAVCGGTVDAPSRQEIGAFDNQQSGARLFRCDAVLFGHRTGRLARRAGKASWLWLFAFFVIITIGELYLSPFGCRS